MTHHWRRVMTFAPSADSSFCNNCSAVDYSSVQGASACMQCIAGKYSPTGSSQCLDCPSRTYTSTAGSSGCINCSAGNYVNVNSTQCIPCPSNDTNIPPIFQCFGHCLPGYYL